MTEHHGVTIWFTGLSGAGKTTISNAVADELHMRGVPTEVLDGDVVRETLSKGLSFSKEDRDTNIRRIGFVAELLTRNGVVVLVAAISPYRAVREEVRARIGNFIEVHVLASLGTLVQRDVKGLYRKAMRGEIANFTGVSDPYEPPLNPALVIDTDRTTVEEAVARVLRHAEEHVRIPAKAAAA